MIGSTEIIPKKVIKVILVGAVQTGKSCLLMQFTENKFRPSYDVTIGVEFGAKEVKINDTPVKLQIWDTAGQEAFASITRSYYKGSHVICVVYNISNRDSFMKIDNYMTDAKQYGSNYKTLIVGNFIDLESKRAVSYEEAMEKANHYGCPYIETSAKTGLNVNQLFTLVGELGIGKFDSEPVDKSKIDLSKPKPKEPLKPLPEESSLLSSKSLSFTEKKLAAIEEIVKKLGAEGSLLVDNIKKILNTKEGTNFDIDSDGNPIFY